MTVATRCPALLWDVFSPPSSKDYRVRNKLGSSQPFPPISTGSGYPYEVPKRCLSAKVAQLTKGGSKDLSPVSQTRVYASKNMNGKQNVQVVMKYDGGRPVLSNTVALDTRGYLM